MSKKLIILGIGGTCIDILDAVNCINEDEKNPVYECVGFLDDNQKSWETEIYGIKVLGGLNLALSYKDCLFVNGIGSSKNFWLKEEIISKTKIPEDAFETIIHPTASVSQMSKIGRGSVILQNVTIASDVIIGNQVIALPNSVINHHDIIKDYTIVASGVCISGGVTVGESCYLGTNSSIIGNITIERQCLVGMGSVVLGDIPENTVVVGSPAKFSRKLLD
jgi:sugar O-acyltransferase (sialic acid O-acetyltransferase NeuD family)